MRCLLLFFILMPAKLHLEEFIDLENTLTQLKKLEAKKLKVGVVAQEGSQLSGYATANEFGATIRPKKGKALAIPVNLDAKNRSPREFSNLKFIPSRKGDPEHIGTLCRDRGGVLEALFTLRRSVTIPERSFLRSSMKDKKVLLKAEKHFAESVTGVITGKFSYTQAMDRLGLMLSAEVKKNITSNISPGNAPLTQALKKTNITLVDEGRLLASIGHEVI